MKHTESEKTFFHKLMDFCVEVLFCFSPPRYSLLLPCILSCDDESQTSINAERETQKREKQREEVLLKTLELEMRLRLSPIPIETQKEVREVLSMMTQEAFRKTYIVRDAQKESDSSRRLLPFDLHSLANVEDKRDMKAQP